MFGFSLNNNKLIAALFIALLGLSSCTDSSEPAESNELTLYAGRSESLVADIVEMFEAESGIKVNVKYAGTSALATALLEEGDQSPADVFWAQDGGALGAIHEAGMFSELPSDMGTGLPDGFRNSGGTWVATSGRARTLAWAPARVNESQLPQSIMDLTDPTWKGRVGWAPGNASFQAFVTAMRGFIGEDETRDWLLAMKNNEPKAYPRNTAIIQAIEAEEVDLGIPNHYYLLRFKNDNADFPVEQKFFRKGDPGNLINVAGAGVLASSDNQEAAMSFVRFLLSDAAQDYFTNSIFEYPVTGSVGLNSMLIPMDQMLDMRPSIDLESLKDLEGTLSLLREVEVL